VEGSEAGLPAVAAPAAAADDGGAGGRG